MTPRAKPPQTVHRRDVARALLVHRGDLLLVTGGGSATWDCAAAGDHELTFPLWNAMGSACSVGLGLALAQPARRVLVATGDGDMLMGLGSIATIGSQRPENLAIVVMDNERYGETGMQASHTAHGTDLAAIAVACGFARTGVIRTGAEIPAMCAAIRSQRGPQFYQIKVVAETLPHAMPPRDGVWLKHRFRRALLGDSALGP